MWIDFAKFSLHFEKKILQGLSPEFIKDFLIIQKSILWDQ